VSLALSLLAAAALLVLAAWFLRRRAGRHQRAVSNVLDAADALEARLRTARAEIAAVAGEDREDPVGAAMREMLRQRLWLQEHGAGATVGELDTVRASIDAARDRIEQQLARIERARAPLH
jgi:methyl-accepting chemotaxis protein